ncbi:MAG: lamin tail domain-containing protein, partial [Mariniphaga sp.]|nr:lamin tail domain-containing protein [Mariniphaga sp.]
MKLKLLLFLTLFAGILTAQEDTIRHLIITEAHLGANPRNFVEISNVGTQPVQLSNFKLGQSLNNAYTGSTFMMLPEKVLQPGESYFIAVVHDFSSANARALGLENYSNPEPSEIAQLADIQVHVSDYSFANNPLGISQEFAKFDSIAPFPNVPSMWFGRYAVYLEQHFANGDSVLIDQVMGVFDTATSTEGVLANKSMAVDQDSYDVAGYPNAGAFANLIRKAVVKQGNMEFIRGTAEDDSEWIALRNYSDIHTRMQPWTFGNHGEYKLDENTLESDVIDVDFANKKLTVPWGLRRPDDIMKNMKKKPGVAWYYQLSTAPGDSMAFACKTGDKLDIIVCGAEAYRATFEIEVSPPTASDNIVVPVLNEGSDYMYYFDQAHLGWPQVTRLEHGNDTITGDGSSIVNRGIPEGLRVDTLLERLEKPANATWEVVPVDGNTKRPDLLDGDVLKVTAQDGSVKEYYIKVSTDVGSNNATLSTITWPDIVDPEFFKFVYGWKGDTIPSFMPNIFNYQLKLPPEIKSVPATVAKPSNLNANVQVKRATFLKGTLEQRTTTYTVTATDDTTIQEYNVVWQPEVEAENIQPLYAEPFFSEIISREYYNNYYLEICNPGNQPLDLSYYMIVFSWSANPADAVTYNPSNWGERYRKYVPGFRWVDEATWAEKRGYLTPDIAVNPIVQGGDVFCMGAPRDNGTWGWADLGWSMYDWPGAVGGKYGQSDVNFYNRPEGMGNPWGEEINNWAAPIAMGGTANARQYLFKILNDSVRQGLKPATDPNDFELLDVIGTVDGAIWTFGHPTTDGGNAHTRFYRKPHINKPNPVVGASMGETPEDSEWVRVNRNNSGISGWPKSVILTPMMDYGKHYFIPSTDHLSTISTMVYKASEGYKNENIKGIVTGETVSRFLANLIKKNDNQTLEVKRAGSENALGLDDVLQNNDVLEVTSADGNNVTNYTLEVSDEGLNSDAVLKSNLYTVTVSENPKSAGEATAGTGTVSGMQYGTQLTTLLANITVPEGAILSVIDSEGGFVPMKRLNFDTVYVDVTVNTNTWLEVIAEDGITSINYQILPVTSSDDAFITSDFFNVIQ